MKMRKHYWFALALVLSYLPSILNAQIEKPQNIYRVTVNSRYVLENGERTNAFYAIGQLMYDSLGRLHTEIDYNWETRYPDNYRWHYYEGITKRKTDFFHNEKLQRIEEYNFNNDVLLAQTIVHKVSLPDTVFLVRENISYTPNRKAKNATGFNSAGKKVYTTTYKYDIKGNEIERKVKGKNATPPDSILYLKCTYLYDSLDRVISKVETIDKIGKPRKTESLSFAYDQNNNVTEKIIRDSNGNLKVRMEYSYRRDNRLQQVKIFDENNALSKHLAWRYEIYKTDDRRHRTLE
jgi:hypothetical protein